MTNDSNERAAQEIEREEDTQEIDMEAVKKVLGKYAANHLELTDEEIEERVEKTLSLTKMGCSMIAKIEKDSELLCADELKILDYNPKKVCELLCSEIAVYDRYVKVHASEAGKAHGQPRIDHQKQLDLARAAFSRGNVPELTMEEMEALLAELMALNKLYRGIDDGLGKMIMKISKDGYLLKKQMDQTFVLRAMVTACMLNLNERSELPEEFELLRKEDGDMQEKIAMMVCTLDRLDYLNTSAFEPDEGGIQLSDREKKMLWGAGTLGAVCFLLLSPFSPAVKACTGFAAAAACLCAAAVIK